MPAGASPIGRYRDTEVMSPPHQIQGGPRRQPEHAARTRRLINMPFKLEDTDA